MGAGLWLPISYAEQRPLAVEAQLRAAEALAAAGDPFGASRLAQELMIRYADTTQAAEARALVEQAARSRPE